jgi:hypothetical protein
MAAVASARSRSATARPEPDAPSNSPSPRPTIALPSWGDERQGGCGGRRGGAEGDRVLPWSATSSRRIG